MFHLTVKAVVDRILLFTNDGLASEMVCVDADADPKIFNGTADGPCTAVMLCYALGETDMIVKDVFSRPIHERPEDANNDVMGNAICVNYFAPTVFDGDADETVPLATAKFCLADIPERLRLGLGLPQTIILQYAEKSNLSTGDMKKRGLNPNASGYFVKTFEHLWPKDEETAIEYGEEKIRISLYAHSIMKNIE